MVDVSLQLKLDPWYSSAISVSNKRSKPGRPAALLFFVVTIRPINRDSEASILFRKVYRPAIGQKAPASRERATFASTTQKRNWKGSLQLTENQIRQ